MTPERWRQVRRLFDAAVELEGDQRGEFLARACARNDSLLAEVELLLRSHEAAGSFIEEPFVHLTLDGVDEVRRIGPYAVERTLGQGGMGTVYLASRADDEYQRQVAIKVLRRELDSEELVRRFRSERQILADLDHPNVARLLEGGTLEDGRPYLVMEYVEGEPFDRHCTERQLSVAQRLALFRKVCDAVHFAHQSLIVHRDLKPGNILVTESGEPKLLDFGIAKLLATEDPSRMLANTQPGLRPMTLPYASPEQVRGEAITTATDVYSLGVVLYRCLTGRHPYTADSQELARAICEQQPKRPSAALGRSGDAPRPDETTVAAGRPPAPPPAARGDGESRKLRRTLRGDLDNIVLKALHKEPRRRYVSAEALAQDVERYLSHRPVLARPDTLAYRSAKFIRRNRWSVAAAAVALGALIAFVVVLFVQRQRTLRQKTRAEEVTRVLIDLFEVSDPDLAKGQQVTAREVMDRGAEELPDRLRDQPELLAELLETIARVYRKLGHYEAAAPLLENALLLRRQVYGPGHRSTASSLIEQGDLALLIGDYGSAELRFSDALTLLAGGRGGDDPAIEQSLSGLGKALQRQGRYPAAAERHREALEMARRLFGEADPRTAENLKDLGDLHRELGDYGEAKDAYGVALEIYRGLYGSQHTEVGALLNNLAITHQAEGDYDLAEERLRSALAIHRQLYGDAHPSLASDRYNLASLLHDRGRYQEAEELCRSVLDFRRQAYGGQHPRVAEALNLLGLIRRDLGDLEAAEGHLRDAAEIWRSQLGESHPDVALGLANLALVLKARGDRAEAESLYRHALRVSRAAFGDEHVRVAAILGFLARLERDKGDLAAAEELYREALAMRRKLLGDDHPDVAETAHNLAVALRHAGDYSAAEELYRDALRIYRAKLGDEHPRVALVQQSLAAVLILLGRPDEAEALARRAVEVLDAALPAGHLWSQAARSVLGESLAGLGRYPEAEALLLASCARLEELQGAGGSLTVKTRKRLVALYEAWGRPEQAARHRALLDG